MLERAKAYVRVHGEAFTTLIIALAALALILAFSGCQPDRLRLMRVETNIVQARQELNELELAGVTSRSETQVKRLDNRLGQALSDVRETLWSAR